ncbi:MAG: DUF1564 domain-containing protein [Leptospira sp.]|nr:DUF1564 domain-containing protein [Leptospira sp.]
MSPSKHLSYHSPTCDQSDLSNSSTLLIPKRLISLYYEDLRRFGNRREYLRHLLRVTKQAVSNQKLKPCKRFKRKYQEKGLNLEKIQFRPYISDWYEFTMIAFFLRRSLTELIVLVMEFTKMKGVPTKYRRIKYLFTIKPSLSSFKAVLKVILRL